MDVSLALLADCANLTKEGKLNVMGIFRRMNVPKLPWAHPQMQLVLQFEASRAEWDSQKHIDIKLLDQDAKQILSMSANVKIPHGRPGEVNQIGTILMLNNVKFETEGDYVFCILVGGETKAEIPLKVQIVPPPTTESGA